MTSPSSSDRDGDDARRAMTPEDALARMASVTASTRGLRTRTEGLTFVIWGICMAASYLTIAVPILIGLGAGGPDPDGFNRGLNDTFGGHGPRSGHRPGGTEFFASRFAPLAWYLIAVVVTTAIWRSASLSFHTGVTTPRLVAVLVGWMLIFLATTVLLTYIEGGRPRSWHLVGWGLVIGLFAASNPLRFTRESRVAATVVAAVVLLTAAYAYFSQFDPRDTSFLSGVGLGAPLLLTGLYLMFRH